MKKATTGPEFVAVKIASALAWVPEAQREIVIAYLAPIVRREVRRLLS